MKPFSAKTITICLLVCFCICSSGFAGWKFGSFDGRRNYKLTVPDAEGVPVTFGLTGSGWGEVDGPSFGQIDLYDTDETSVLIIATHGKNTHTAVGDITVDGPVYAILAPTTSLEGDILITGMLAELRLDDANDGSFISIGEPSGDYASDPNFGVIMKFDQVSGLVIDCYSPIKSFTAVELLSDIEKSEIFAPSIETLMITADKRRKITGNFEANLFLDANSVKSNTALQYAKIPGKIVNCEWNITGNVKTVRANNDVNDWVLNVYGDVNTLCLKDVYNSDVNVSGSIDLLRTAGWFDSNMAVGMNMLDARIKQLHGNVNIGGDAKNFTVCEPMAAGPRDIENPVGILSVAGKANVKNPTGNIHFLNDTVYTSEPNMYRLEDLRLYDTPDAFWKYTSKYRISASGKKERGFIYSYVNVLDVNNIPDGNSFTVENETAGDTYLTTTWYNDGDGTHLTGFSSDTVLGLLDLTLDVNMPPCEYLTPRHGYKDAGTFTGTWDITVVNRKGEPRDIEIGDISGTVETACLLLGHEQITLPAGVYMTAKVRTSVIMKGTTTVTIGENEYPGKFVCRQNQVFWSVPEIGIVKAVTRTKQKVRANKKTYYFKIAQTDQLTDYLF